METLWGTFESLILSASETEEVCFTISQSPPFGKAIFCCGNLSIIKSPYLFWTCLLCWCIPQMFLEGKDVQWQRGGLFWCTPQSCSHLDFGLVQSWILGMREALMLPWEYGQAPGWRANIMIEFRNIYFETRIWPVQSLERVLASISAIPSLVLLLLPIKLGASTCLATWNKQVYGCFLNFTVSFAFVGLFLRTNHLSNTNLIDSKEMGYWSPQHLLQFQQL